MPVPPPRPPNYRTIAEACGVGKTTVGRVFQGNGYVSEPVRRKVLDEAAKLGYRPDPSLSALSRRRWPNGARPATATLAWIFRTRQGEIQAQSPDFRGAQARACELGYSMDVFNLSDYSNARALSRVIYSRGIRGVLIQALRDGMEIDLDWGKFFALFVGPENDTARVHNVQADFRTAMHQGVAACTERGYRRIGIALMNFRASGTNIPFRAQALFERERLERTIGPQPQLFEFQPEGSDPKHLLNWLRSEKPEAIVSSNIQPYYYLTAPAAGDRRLRPRRIPQDVGFICLRGASELPGLTCLDLREHEQGRQAVDLMHQQLQHGDIGRPEIPLRLLIPPKFILGETLPVRRPLCNFRR